MSGSPRSGASLPDTEQPRIGPGVRSLPRRATRAMATAALASRARFGPALELLPGQPAPARARPVSAGPAPRSWLGSAPGSRSRKGAERGQCGDWEVGVQPRVRARKNRRGAEWNRHPSDLRRQGKHTRSCTGMSQVLGRRCSQGAVRSDEFPEFLHRPGRSPGIVLCHPTHLPVPFPSPQAAFPFPKPALISQLERGEAPWCSAPQGALDGEGPRGISSGYPFLKPAGISHLEQVEEPLNLKLQGESPSLICNEGVLKSEEEDFILKEEIFEEAQEHMVLSSGPQWCGSQEFWFGKTWEEEKSRLGRWPDYPNGGSVENSTNDIIEVIVKDEMISVEECSENTDVNTHLVEPQRQNEMTVHNLLYLE
ncbi:hypothetical protein HPG69_012911 [Diceros bicornis minor]|uniref:Uncharacterized protein n=1 Tax=Diceros bicornis minor TaxID=77932 RepID=A0A7J7F147_DICBM|nr:hypothetical protein HPG69_012911 [Diceros bicornis minor]